MCCILYANVVTYIYIYMFRHTISNFCVNVHKICVWYTCWKSSVDGVSLPFNIRGFFVSTDSPAIPWPDDDWLLACFTDWLTYWLTDWLTDFLIGRLIDWLTGRLIDWLTGWLIDWFLTGWLIDWFLAGWQTNWLTAWLLDWLIDW